MRGALALVLLGACEADLSAVADRVEAVAARPPLSDLEDVPATPFAGVVLEHADAGPYDYVRLALCDGGDRWVVGLDKGLVPGAYATVKPVGAQHAFASRRLARTFDTLWFGVLTPEEGPCPAS